MSFLQRLIDSQDLNKKPKRHPQFDLPDEMAFFSHCSTSTQFLNAPPAPSRKRSQRLPRPRDDVDEFLSSDLELSFASTVSLHSPPRESIALTPENEYLDPMDISPIPAPKPAFTHAPSKENDDSVKPLTRPRAFTSAARMFGRDMSNGISPALLIPPAPKSGSSHVNAKRTQRAALPLEWLAARPSEPTNNDENMLPDVCYLSF